MTRKMDKSEKQRLLTIGELSKTLALKASALRFYEREGLLQPASRSASGYRLYDQESIEQLRFIRSAQSAGFTLDDIRALLQFESDPRTQCKHEVQELINRRLKEIELKIKDLKRVKLKLTDSLSRCQSSSGKCPVLTELKPDGASIRRKR